MLSANDAHVCGGGPRGGAMFRRQRVRPARPPDERTWGCSGACRRVARPRSPGGDRRRPYVRSARRRPRLLAGVETIVGRSANAGSPEPSDRSPHDLVRGHDRRAVRWIAIPRGRWPRVVGRGGHGAVGASGAVARLAARSRWAPARARATTHAPMNYPSLAACVQDLERHGQLVRIPQELDPHLELAEVQRRVYAAGGPAILFERVKGSPFPAVSNLFGTVERGRFIFRSTLRRARGAIELRADPTAALRRPWRYWWAPWVGLRALPRRRRGGPILAGGDHRLQAASDRILAGRRWPVCHAAPGLQRGSASAGADAQQPGDVSGAAGRRAVRGRPGSRAPLPDSSRDWCSSRRGAQSRPVPAGEHLCGRSAGAHLRGPSCHCPKVSPS